MSKLIFSKGDKQSKQLSRLFGQDRLRRIHQGIYTDDLRTPLESLVKQNWMDIVSYIVPKGILSFRTAVDLTPTPYQDQLIIFLTSSYEKTINLPGLVIKIIKGNQDEFIEQILPNLARSNVPRFLLENLSTVRKSDYKGIKTIGDKGVELFLAKVIRNHGEAGVNQIRDEAKIVGAQLGFEREQKKLNQLISVLLSSQTDINLTKTSLGKAIANKQAYDPDRVKLFEALCVYFKKCDFKLRKYKYSKTSFKNIAFFESYFSNFIEGTEFVIDEAEDIVFKGTEIIDRHADSHDVLANFNLANDYSEMCSTPGNVTELLELLCDRHAYLMRERPEKNPGQFKTVPNKAGNTVFVLPSEVIGTLSKAFDLYQLLAQGIQRALFIHFLISEVHPFLDGNGRLSRIMMNAELVSTDLTKIIIPTVHRENYLNGLRLASRDQNFHTYCKVMDQAQAYSDCIHWSDYGDAREKLEIDCADKTADEGLPIFNRVLRKLELSEFAK